MNGQKARNTAAADIFRTHGVARALRRDHQTVDVTARLDQVEMDIQAMREGNRRAGTNVLGDLVAIDIGLQLVRGQHHHDVAPGSRLGNVHDLEAGGLGLGAAGAESARSATATSATPLSLRLAAWAWP